MIYHHIVAYEEKMSFNEKNLICVMMYWEKNMRMKHSIYTLLTFFLCLPLTACDDPMLSPNKLTTLTMWHVYGAQTYSPMNTMIEKFNQSEGKKHGVKIVVTSVSNSTAIHNSLVAAAKNEVGASDLPDLFTCYPKTLKAMGADLALDWNSYFSAKELTQFVPEFIAEGRFGDKTLIFPISKSSNALFINANLYETFAKETNKSYADLTTWEQTFATVEAFYNWSGGKAFFMYDDWIHYPMVSMAAFGPSLFNNNQIDWNNLYFTKVMRPLLRAGIMGHVCLMPGYSTKAIMIDKAVAGVESTASVLYFKDNVTHADNTRTQLKVKALPVPYFEGGKRVALQRGTGLVARASSKEKNDAAALFCKWITSENINLEFVMQGGYLPVRKNDFDRLHAEIDTFTFPRDRYKSLYITIQNIYKDNTFITAPSFTDYGKIEQAFPKVLRKVLEHNHTLWQQSAQKDEAFLNERIEASFIQLQEEMRALMLENEQ